MTWHKVESFGFGIVLRQGKNNKIGENKTSLQFSSEFGKLPVLYLRHDGTKPRTSLQIWLSELRGMFHFFPLACISNGRWQKAKISTSSENFHCQWHWLLSLTPEMCRPLNDPALWLAEAGSPPQVRPSVTGHWSCRQCYHIIIVTI